MKLVMCLYKCGCFLPALVDANEKEYSPCDVLPDGRTAEQFVLDHPGLGSTDLRLEFFSLALRIQSQEDLSQCLVDLPPW